MPPPLPAADPNGTAVPDGKGAKIEQLGGWRSGSEQGSEIQRSCRNGIVLEDQKGEVIVLDGVFHGCDMGTVAANAAGAGLTGAGSGAEVCQRGVGQRGSEDCGKPVGATVDARCGPGRCELLFPVHTVLQMKYIDMRFHSLLWAAKSGFWVGLVVGSDWFGLVRIGSDWFGLVRIGPKRFPPGPFHPFFVGLCGLLGLVWSRFHPRRPPSPPPRWP